MELKSFWTALAITLLSACGGNGTEIANIPNPNETPQKKFETEYYSLHMDFLPGWTYTDLSLEDDPDAFTAEAPNTEAFVHIQKGNRAHFTAFQALLTPGQTLIEYVRRLRPNEEVDETQFGSGDAVTYWAFAYQEEPGTRGGSVLDIYLSDNTEVVVWLRVELIGTPAQKEANFNEFWDMVSTLEVHLGRAPLTGE